MSNNPYVVSEEEKYFFDLRGYLIMRNVLSQDEIDACNAAIDANADKIIAPRGQGNLSRGATALEGKRGRHEMWELIGLPSPHREPFRDLLVHPIVVSRLNEYSGKGFRLDHGPALIESIEGDEGHWLHASGEPFNPAVCYHQQNGKIYARGITVAWQLTDVNAGDGGFACVPGSHKTAEPTPDDLREMKDDMGLVYQPEMKAGDVLFFCETMTHGTLPWKGKGTRRSVLYKYASRAANRAVGKHFTPQQRYGDWVNELTPAQQAVLYGPGMHQGEKSVEMPTLESDGKTVTVTEGPLKLFG